MRTNDSAGGGQLSNNTLEDIVAQMQAVGLSGILASQLKVDGKFHRYKPDGAKGAKKSAWYVLYQYTTASGREFFTGAFGRAQDTYKVQVEQRKWSSAEREEFKAEQARRNREVLEQRRTAARAAREKAQRLWDGARIEGRSAYLDRKKVRAYGTRFGFRDSLMVPVRDLAGQLWSVQWILADGSKRFTTDSEVRGHFHILGEYSGDGWLVFAEGYATAASIRVATGLPVVTAFDAGNLAPVIEAWRKRHPKGQFLIAGDDDRHLKARLNDCARELGFVEPIEVDGSAHTVDTSAGKVFLRAKWVREKGEPAYIDAVWTLPDGSRRERKFVNAGRTKALAAAAEHHCRAVFPVFPAGDASGTDFNDLHVAYDIGAVKAQIETATGPVAPALPEEPVPEAPRTLHPQESLARAVEQLHEAALAGASTPEAPFGKGRKQAPPPPPPPSGGGPPDDVPPEDHWHLSLQRDKGRLRASEFNAYTILLNHQAWQGVLGYDLFADAVCKHKAPPIQNGEPGYWTDLDDARTKLWISEHYGVEIPDSSIIKAVLLVADRHRFHKVREWLESLKWDGVSRVANWLRTYCRALGDYERSRMNDEEFGRLERYVRLISVKWLVAAVARIFEPGCKVDNMLVLEGDQGQAKSTALEVLASKELFSDAPVDFENKDTFILMFGKWIIEMGELDALNKADASSAKRFISQPVNRFRPFYGRRAQDWPRQCVFGGTVNYDVYLKDDSGNRRFWPVWTEEIDLVGLKRDRDQLWAEAVQLYRDGVIWWTLAEERPLFKEQEDRRYQDDAWHGKVVRYVNGTDDPLLGNRKDRVTTDELLEKAVKLDAGRMDRQAQQRVASILRRLGWVRKRESVGDRQWFYARPAGVHSDVPPPRQREPGDDDEPI